MSDTDPILDELQKAADSVEPTTPASPAYTPLIDLIDIDDPSSQVNALHFHGGDPNFVYAWLNTRPEMLEANKMKYGYEVCGSDDPIRTLVAPNASGERRISDVVLCRIAKTRYDKLVEKHRRETMAALAGPHERWVEETKAAGLSPIGSNKVFQKEGM